MRVFLISANTEQINMPVLPLGMACVAAAAQAAGHEVNTVNLMARQDIPGLSEEAVRGFDPQLIGISVRNIDDQVMENPKFMLDPVKEVVAQCRRVSDAPIVLGGAGYSLFPKTALAYLQADMGIQGEGETAFVTLLERLSRRADLSDVPGLWVPKTGLQKRVNFPKTLDNYPVPLPHVHLSIPPDIEKEEIWIPFQTRRGCPMKCTYCSTPVIEGGILRECSPERAIDGLSQYVAAGFDHFFFVDNTFNFPPSYAKALCDGIIKRGLNISWRAILYPWKVDDELVEKMAQAGCREVALGCESGSETMLLRFNKRFKPSDVLRVSEMLRKQGIQCMGFLMLGGPGETKDTVEESLAFAELLDPDAMKVTTGIRIYPHTPLHQLALSEGVVSSEDDLLFPKFYMVRELEEWLRKTVAEAAKNRSHWMA